MQRSRDLRSWPQVWERSTVSQGFNGLQKVFFAILNPMQRFAEGTQAKEIMIVSFPVC